MDAHWIDVFHVADRDAIVSLVPHNFVFNLFPVVQVLLNENLPYDTLGEGRFRSFLHLLFVPEDCGAFPSEGICDPEDYGIANLRRLRETLLNGVRGGTFRYGC